MDIDEIIKKAIEEDLGEGDHTSLACIPCNAVNKAQLVAKQDGILCGIDIARKVYVKIDKNVLFTALKSDGDKIKAGDVVFTVEGSSISILSGERTALNFMQRMSGIATYTHTLVALLSGTQVKLLDTRKTTPNLRRLEKYAVSIGGAENHRFGLYDMIMIKDNHIDFAGGISQAIDNVHHYLEKNKNDLKIEIEVRNFEELSQVLEHGGVHRIMLDNFSPSDLKTAVDIIGKRFETEASGGITQELLPAYAQTGVDYISVGALTHQIKSLDLSLVACK